MSIISEKSIYKLFIFVKSVVTKSSGISKAFYRYLNFFCSPELKAEVSFSYHLSSGVCLSVCPSVCLSVCKLFTFSSCSPEPLGQFKPNLLSTKHPWTKGIQVCLNERPCLFPREDKNDIAKIHRRNLKIFSRTYGPI